MKTLTPTAQYLAAQDAATVFPALRIEWSGATGAKWYSDASRAVDGQGFDARVSDWGQPTAAMGGGQAWSFELADEDGAIRSIIKAEGIDRKRVTLYYVWPASVQADWVPIFGGALATPFDWSEHSGVIRFTAETFDAYHAAPLLVNIDDSTFPHAGQDYIGRCLPMVYGYRQHVQAVPAQGFGPATYLTRRFDWGESTFKVKDASDFPASSAGSPIRVWVGGEMVEGYFTDDEFTCTARPILLKSGVKLQCQGYEPYGPYQNFNLDADEATGFWCGTALRFRVHDQSLSPPGPIGPYQYRRILQYKRNGANDSEVYLEHPFCKAPPWVEYIPAGWVSAFVSWLATQAHVTEWYDCDITTSKEAHDRGTEVFYAGSASGDEYVYIVNDRASNDVERAYAMPAEAGDKPYQLPTSLYTVDLDDNRYRAQIGCNVTTITFKRPPHLFSSDIVGTPVTDNVTADVRGPASNSVLVTNPARIIEHMARRGGVAAADIDSASVAAAASARSNVRMAFVLDSQRTLSEALNEVAEQACLAIDWSAGKLRIVCRRHDIDAGSISLAFTLSRNNYRLASRSAAATDVRNLVNEIRGTYPYEEQEKQLVVRDAASQALHGLCRREMATWAYNHRNPVHWALAWHLYMDRFVHDVAVAETFLHQLAAEAGDIVEVDIPDYAAPRRGWIRRILYNLGTRERCDAIRFEIVVPKTTFYDTGYTWPDPTYADPADSTEGENDFDGSWSLPWDGGGHTGYSSSSSSSHSTDSASSSSSSSSYSVSVSSSSSSRTSSSSQSSSSSHSTDSTSSSSSSSLSFSSSSSSSTSSSSSHSTDMNSSSSSSSSSYSLSFSSSSSCSSSRSDSSSSSSSSQSSSSSSRSSASSSFSSSSSSSHSLSSSSSSFSSSSSSSATGPTPCADCDGNTPTYWYVSFEDVGAVCADLGAGSPWTCPQAEPPLFCSWIVNPTSYPRVQLYITGRVISVTGYHSATDHVSFTLDVGDPNDPCDHAGNNWDAAYGYGYCAVNPSCYIEPSE